MDLNEVEQGISIPIRADLSHFSEAMRELETHSKRFGSVFSGSIRSAIQNGKSFEDTLKSMALRLSNIGLSAALRPLENSVSNLFGTFASSFIGAGSKVIPFAKGGVVASPTFFNANGATGVMGEAGAEAIMPLARGSDGKLGVRAAAAPPAMNVVFNVSTPDVQSFRQSESQLSAMLTRTVGRGRRNL